MEHDQIVPDHSVPSESRPDRVRAPRSIVVGATALLSGFVLLQAPVLWSEWQELRRDWENDRQSQPIGFIGISPNPTFAQPPRPWAREEGNDLLLWSNWDGGAGGHHWFRIKRNDLDTKLLGRPFGRDTIRALDQPIIETRSGPTWRRMKSDTPVVSLERGGAVTAYPLLVVQKVEAINDTIGGHPVLLINTPFVPEDQAVDVFDPELEGRRLTFGSAGYLLRPAGRPLLYDRQTESLWSMRGHELVCVGGTLKGATLQNRGHGVPVLWSAWVAKHAQGRLVVGAARPQPVPHKPPRPALVSRTDRA